jgi:amino acid adenylation domain-containing protein
MDPGTPLLNQSAFFGLTGPLDPAALRRSLQEVVSRHEVLRTEFAVRDGQLFQMIAPALIMDVPVIDLRDRSADDRQAETRRRASEEAQRPFDLARVPLLRAMLLRTGEEEHALFLVMHHIIFDGWSTGILTREISILYEAFSSGKPSPLPDLPMQYADFAESQRRSLEGDELASQLAYWKGALGGDVTELTLPTDRQRPAVQTFGGAAESVTLPRHLSEALAALSRREGVTLFMILLAGFQTLLHRYTGQHDISVGTPVADRDEEDLEGLIGCFVNILILRTDLSGNPTFRELLRRIRTVATQAYAHKATPFQRLVEELQPKRELSRAPLVQVFVNMLNFPHDQLTLPRVKVQRLASPTIGSMHDLTLYAEEHQTGIRLNLVYNPDLFDAATITRMLGHFQILLEAVVVDAGQRLSALSLLPEHELHQLLVEWNHTEAPYPEEMGLHQLVERQVSRTPDAVAAVLEEAQLTYRELNRQANQLAHYLRALGVGPETLVGISMERSFQMAIGLLGVLKAGGAYVPLDPTYPPERLAFMLHDARPAVLLTQQHLLDRIPGYAGSVLCVDRDRGHWEGQPETNPEVPTVPDNLAYVIYTSGSTGRPKGVLVSHRSVVNYLTFLARTYELGSADAVLQLTSLSFDPSVRDIFGPLTTGARIILMRDAEILDPLAVLTRIRRHGVTRILAIVPSMLRPLLATAEDEGLSVESIQTILVSGEPLYMSDVARARNFARHALIVNHYGPTECTMTVTCHSLGAMDAGRSLALAGRPIDNVRLYILDGNLNPVPIGVPGQVHIGGVGLARGYLNRPELTAEKFIVSPFESEPGARLYKTGDMGRYLLDGTLELLGRIDHQVKVRGIRVELGEIEAVLCEHPAVRETAVVMREDGTGDPRLVAYAVAGSEPAPDRRELRSFLQEKLPGYMVPADFVILDALPLGPNRKVDRRALPWPDHAVPARDKVFVAPRTVVEEALEKMWAQVLRQDRVGIHDSFFELGGHSLLAGRLLSRVRERFHVSVSLRAFFAAPTVADLATAIVEGLAERVGDGVIAQTLAELRGLSDEDARRQLGEAGG